MLRKRHLWTKKPKPLPTKFSYCNINKEADELIEPCLHRRHLFKKIFEDDLFLPKQSRFYQKSSILYSWLTYTEQQIWRILFIYFTTTAAPGRLQTPIYGLFSIINNSKAKENYLSYHLSANHKICVGNFTSTIFPFLPFPLQTAVIVIFLREYKSSDLQR